MKIKINSILEKKGLTIYWLSKETGISYAAINKLCNGKSENIKFSTLDKICEKLCCKISDILEEEYNGIFIDNNIVNTPNSKRGFLYVAKFKNQTWFKMGITTGSHNRFAEYTRLPEEMEYKIISYIDCYDQCERILQNTFAGKRQRGNNSEWFNFTEEDLEFIKKFLEQYRNEESDKKEAEIVSKCNIKLFDLEYIG